MTDKTAVDYPLADLTKIPTPPSWFTHAVAKPFETHWVKVGGLSIEARSWGTPGKPGLIFIHGAAAHLGWWAFIAPFFAEDFHVVTLSFSGMGNSDWRKAYSAAGFAEEMWAVVDAVKMSSTAQNPPLLVAHSMGGMAAIYSSAVLNRPTRAIVLVDVALPGPGLHPPIYTGHKIYPTLEAALTRFRLAPPQPCENRWIAEYLGRMSLKEIVDDNGKAAWTWRFDPNMLGKVEIGPIDEHLRQVRDPLIVINGAFSQLTTNPNLNRMKDVAPQGTKFMVMPEAYHHVMIDQPLAMVATLRALFTSFM